MRFIAKLGDLGVLLLTTSAALFSFIVFGLNHARSWKDASEYSAYAVNLLTRGVYSETSGAFDIFREPGYPFFVTLAYRIFGIENVLAAVFLQALLLALLGFVVYRIFKIYGEQKIGAIAAFAVAVFPSYGYYANELTSELVFTFMLGLVFFLCVRIWRERSGAPWHLFALLGFACGYASLVRLQFVFFLPFIAVFYVLFVRPPVQTAARNAALAFALFGLILGSWVLYVHANTGKYAITEGRQQEMLFYRAERSELGYAGLTAYARDWVHRSISGGYNSQLLMDNEFKALNKRYHEVATTTSAVSRVQRENVSYILAHPGVYLYGNLIEAVKLGYLEHDYSDSQSRYFRPALYALTYAFCLFGLYHILRRKGDIRTLGVLAILMIGYNFLVLTPFDVIPRYNTPFLFLYLVIGFAGIVLFRRGRGRPRS